MVLLWNALVTLRFCWAIREFTLVWIEIIFEILSILGAGILPDTDLFGLVWKNMSEGRIYYSRRGKVVPNGNESSTQRRRERRDKRREAKTRLAEAAETGNEEVRAALGWTRQSLIPLALRAFKACLSWFSLR